MAGDVLCDDGVVAQTCVVCASGFKYQRQGSGRLRKTCSDECNRQRKRWLQDKYREDGRYKQPGRWASIEASRARYAAAKQSEYPCKTCGSTFLSRQAKATYCSLECRDTGVAKVLRDRYLATARRCEKCDKPFRPSRPSQTQRLRAYIQRFCSRECAGRGSHKGTSTRPVVMSTIKWTGRYETIDPLVVLERDNWRCHLCGVSTPKRLRGTTDNRAPEVDHIVPVAAGGDHTYANCACACRLCNRRKGDRPMGQLRLFG